MNIYQTIFNDSKTKPYGNCMQAVWATLLNCKLEDVPHFLEEGDTDKYGDWFDCYYQFLQLKGYKYEFAASNPRMLGYYGDDRFNEIKDYTGVNGYFEALVLSPKYFDINKYENNQEYYNAPRHAVIIDKEFNIVHDPNHNYKDIKEYPLAGILGHNGITDIFFTNKIKL